MQALHPNSVGMSIDDAMAPLLEKGSYILGNKNYSDEAIKRCVNQVCIVETRMELSSPSAEIITQGRKI